MLQVRFLVLVLITLDLATSRLLSHPWNFTPMIAMILFGGAHFSSKKAAFLVPIAALLLSDFVLDWFFYGGFTPFNLASSACSYLCFVGIVGLGLWIRRRRSPLRIAASALTGSVLFFLITNFGSWVLDQTMLATPLYSADFFGIWNCYLAGVPFFRSMLVGDVLYTALLFGGFALLQQLVPTLREPVATSCQLVS